MNTDALYRQIAVILMMTVFFAQSFSSCFIVADYYANKQVFAKQCINKARPELHCNGKCQMRKQVSNEEKKDQQAPERKDNKSDVVLSSKSFSPQLAFFTTDISHPYPSFSFGREIKMPRTLFRPPIS